MSELQKFKEQLDALCDVGKDAAERETNTKKLLKAADDLIAQREDLQALIKTPGWQSRISGNTRIIEGTEQRPVIDLVQQGGSMLGIGLLGYTYVMERMGVRFRSMAGTSAGAINTMLLAAIPEDIYKERSIFRDDGENAVKSEFLAYAVANKNFAAFLDRKGTLGRFEQWMLKKIHTVDKWFPWFCIIVPLILLSGSYLLYTMLDRFIYNTANGLTEKEVNHYNFVSGTAGACCIAILVVMLLVALFRKTMGFNKGDTPYDWMKSILGTSYVNIHTTKDLRIRRQNQPQPVSIGKDPGPIDGRSRLVVITANLTHNRIVKFPEQNVDYWDLQYADNVCPAAYVRASMSLPFIFYAMMPADRYVDNPPNGGAGARSVRVLARFVDGGMLSNFPIREFHVPPPQVPNYPTFGVLLGIPKPDPSNDPPEKRKPTKDQGEERDTALKNFNKLSVLKFILSFISTFRNFYDTDFLENHPELQKLVCPVNTKDFNSLDFGMSPETRQALFAKGAETAINQLVRFNWTEYLALRQKINAKK